MFDILLYEWRRAIARKKVIVLVLVSLFFEIAVYLALYLVPSKAVRVILIPLYPYMWAVGALLPQSLLLHFLAISIASGSMSEEYEQGTIDFFLTKPVTRIRFYAEKWLGSFTLLAMIYGLMVVLSLVFSFWFFGAQTDLIDLPKIVGLVLVSSLVFFSVAFSIGEILRRSSLSFIISSSLLIGSILVSDILVFIGNFTHIATYISIALALPSWGATQLPFLPLANSQFSLFVKALDIFPLTVGSIQDAVVSIFLYTVVPVILSLYSFTIRDVPKRVS
ncbi:ABC transporter permease [Stygiolobus azoricus]|uniref:ABC transporter permease subunit n=1 Tax=Stygiolobus azoricus TaxID=41675 RepID=A0A650CMB4_9CREN|nr:ABC transporter permease [Stygiolobus azoricus]QGR18637.1 ABC transporter permease subunit [Stygiolobus azoricus]